MLYVKKKYVRYLIIYFKIIQFRLTRKVVSNKSMKHKKYIPPYVSNIEPPFLKLIKKFLSIEYIVIFSYSTSMSAGDCYELGKALYNEKDFKNALAWMMVALRKYHDENLEYPFTEVDILEYIGFSHYLLGKLLNFLLNLMFFIMGWIAKMYYYM